MGLECSIHFPLPAALLYYTSRKKNRALEERGLEKERGRRIKKRKAKTLIMKKHKGGGRGVKRDEVRVVRGVPKSGFTIASIFGLNRTLTPLGLGINCQEPPKAMTSRSLNQRSRVWNGLSWRSVTSISRVPATHSFLNSVLIVPQEQKRPNLLPVVLLSGQRA